MSTWEARSVGGEFLARWIPHLEATTRPGSALSILVPLTDLPSTVLHGRPPSAGSVVADRTLRRGPDVPLNIDYVCGQVI
jgi:hypothetical protein